MKDMLKEEVGRRLTKIRMRLGLKQQRMAVLLGIKTMSYSRNERGQHYPSAVTLNQLARQFDISLDWLFLGEGNMFRGEKQAEESESKSSDLIQKDIEEMIDIMKHIPMVRYSVLDHFHRLKIDNQAYIDKELEKIKETG
jgi:transcriptional regulator with XRE-family HTH domain